MNQHAVATGEAAVDQVMGLAAAALKEAQVAFAACVAAQPAMLSDIISRLRSLLLSSARLSEGELLRRTDDLGPTTAQTAPHRVWRWDLGADGVALGTGPGGNSASVPADTPVAYATLASAATARLQKSCSPARRSVSSAVVCTLATAPAWRGCITLCDNKQDVLLHRQLQPSNTAPALQGCTSAASLGQ